MKVFEMTIRVAAENLTCVLDVLKDSADLVDMKQVETVEQPKRLRQSTKRHVPRAKGVTSRSLIMDTVAKGTVTAKALEKLLAANGFAETSARPAVNELIRNGFVVRLADGVYGAKA